MIYKLVEAKRHEPFLKRIQHYIHGDYFGTKEETGEKVYYSAETDFFETESHFYDIDNLKEYENLLGKAKSKKYTYNERRYLFSLSIARKYIVNDGYSKYFRNEKVENIVVNKFLNRWR